MLRAGLFGPLTVEVDGHPVPRIAGLKPRALLAWLLLHPGPHARGRVAAQFWPDVLDTSARASLRSALWVVRAALEAAGGSNYLEADRTGVGITGHLPRTVDAEAFDRLGRSDNPAELEEAYVLAREPLLADLADDWVLDARDDYREQLAGVALRLADAKEQRAELGAAVHWTRRALVHVPLRESVHRTLMRRLAESGERAEALAVYERCRAVLAAELDTPPSAETEHLAGLLRNAARADGAPPVGPPTGKGAGLAMEQPHPRRRVTAGALRQTAAAGFPPPPDPGAHAALSVRPPRAGLPLAGRDQELDTLVASWDEARRGRGGVVLISGAAGLGKTRLATELATRAVADGARVGAGAAYELAGAPPFALWSEALHELIAHAPVPPPDAAWPSDLARLCRAVERQWGRPASPSAPDPEQERTWLFESVAEAFTWCARDRPLLVVLDDLHLADRASTALLAYVGRRLARRRALLVITRRPATTGQHLTLALDALARGAALTVDLALVPLRSAETALVVDAAAPALPVEVRRRVVTAAEGNPLLAHEAARAAAAGHDPASGLRAWVRAPLTRLPGSARLLVDIAAAAGRPLEPGAAGALVGAEHLAVALDAACREDLLDASDGRVRFTHTLIRDACYAELTPARRVWLHGRLADVLQARPMRAVAEVARHLVLAERPDEARSYLVAAATQARALGALDEAAGFLREAVSIAPEAPASAAELWLALAETEAWRGSRDEHDAAFDRAVSELDGSREPAALVGAYVSRGRCLRTTLCYPRDARAAYTRALDLIETGELDLPELRALALAGTAWVESASGDVTRGQQLIATAETLPEVATDPTLRAELVLARGMALLRSRRYAEAERESEKAAQLASTTGRADLADTALIQAAVAAAARGSASRSLELAGRAVRGRRSTTLAATGLAIRAFVLSRAGRHAEAGRAAREEVTLLKGLGDATHEATGQYDMGCVALAAGHHDEAVERLSAALRTTPSRFPRALARLRLAEARLHTGDPDGADAELARVPLEPVSPADLPETLVPQLERLEGLVAAARGRLGLALHRLSSAERGWRRLFTAAAPDDPFATSLVALGPSRLEVPVEPGVELGRVLADRARVLVERGRSGEARAAVDEASALAARLAYDGYRDSLQRVAEMEV
ncbi:hypothetical protein GCM10023215_47140 [Pseudonocardia yuanmonensis]|uniref:Bacterial transcriptional activator domain-containing protein n=2 Tax=Pseudonocardia yuanmonensis TaxID=1095914 RepID=A0ABP8XBI4_9PSEU